MKAVKYVAPVLAVVMTMSVASAREVTILPLGDSITENGAWRYALWKKMIDAGYEVEYMGALNNKEYEDYKGHKWDGDHQSVWGISAQGLYRGLQTSENYWKTAKQTVLADTDVVSIREGSEKSFGVRLAHPPKRDISVNVSVDKGEDAIFVREGEQLVFTPDNWNEYRIVTLAAKDDDDKESRVTSVVCSCGKDDIAKTVNVLVVDDGATGPKPVLHWKFDEQEGARAYDCSGNGFHGRISGAKPGQTGKVGGAFAFDKCACVQTAGRDELVFDKTGLTFAAWIYPTSYDGIPGHWRAVFGRQYWQGAWFGLKHAGNIEGNMYAGDTPIGGKAELNTWTQIAVTLDVTKETDNMTIYVNGEPTKTATVAKAEKAAPTCVVGRLNLDKRDNYFVGLIDDVRMYNKPLNADAIKALCDTR